MKVIKKKVDVFVVAIPLLEVDTAIKMDKIKYSNLSKKLKENHNLLSLIFDRENGNLIYCFKNIDDRYNAYMELKEYGFSAEMQPKKIKLNSYLELE